MTITMKERSVTEVDQLSPEMFSFFGIALVVLGLVAIASAFLFTVGTVMLIGALLVAAAIAEFVHCFRARGHKNILFNVLSGIVYLLVGTLLLAHPVLGALSLTLVLGAFFLVAGIIRLSFAVTHRQQRSWGLFSTVGITDLILASLIFLGWPATGLWVIGLFVGIELIIHGAAWIALPTKVKDM